MENIGKGKQTGTNADRNGSDWRVRGNVTATAIPRKTSSATMTRTRVGWSCHRSEKIFGIHSCEMPTASARFVFDSSRCPPGVSTVPLPSGITREAAHLLYSGSRELAEYGSAVFLALSFERARPMRQVARSSRGRSMSTRGM